jgi:hypothetical protein
MVTSIDALQGVEDPTERVVAAAAYLRRLHGFEGEAIRVRDEAIRSSPVPGPALAERAGISLGTVKAARRRRS